MSAMTEEEARKRWCPFARSTSEPGNRAPYGTPRDLPVDPEYEMAMAAEFPCIASRCMAWRWDTAQTYTTARGFCGLAGPVTP